MYGDYQTAKILHETRLKEAEQRRLTTEARHTRRRRPFVAPWKLPGRAHALGRGREHGRGRGRRLAALLRPLVARR